MTVLTGLPDLSGAEASLDEAVRVGRSRPLYAGHEQVRLPEVDAAFAIALHMHQPLIPAADGGDMRDADIVSNLKWMMDHQDIGDNHNAPVFRWCYARMGEFIPKLLAEGG